MSYAVNPISGYREEVPRFSWLWCFLFGPFFFAYKGIWKHFIISLLLAGVTFGLSLFVYPFLASKILINHYNSLGWTIIDNDDQGLLFNGAEELSNVLFKEYLIARYGIRKNEILGEFIIGNCSYKNIDESLQHAHDLYKKDKDRISAKEFVEEKSSRGTYFDFAWFHSDDGRFFGEDRAGSKVYCEFSSLASFKEAVTNYNVAGKPTVRSASLTPPQTSVSS